MKIIKPIALTANNVSSDAPTDNYPTWSPVGRDFLAEFGDVRLSEAGAYIYAADFEGPAEPASIQRQNLSTGLTEAVLIDALNLTVSPSNIKVSPDNSKISVVGENANGVWRIEVFSLATGNLLWSDNYVEGTQRFTQGAVAWSPDSSMVAYFARTVPNPQYEDTKTVTRIRNFTASTTVDGTPFTDFRGTAPTYQGWGGYPYDLCWKSDSSTVYASCRTWEAQFNGDAEGALTSTNVSTGSTNYVSAGLVMWPQRIEYNRLRGEIIGTGGSDVATYDASTLNQQTEKPDIGSFYPIYGNSIVVSPYLDELVINVTASPYHQRFKLSDYSLIGQAGALARYIQLYTDGYYASYESSGGFALHDTGTATQVTETYPQVVAGDKYLYDNKVYEVLSDNQERPDAGAATSPPTWLSLGAVNNLRLIDGKIGTFTEADGGLVVTIAAPDLIDGLGMFNLQAASFRIELIDSADAVVFDSGAISLADLSGIQDWYTYFYDPESYQTDSVFTALPPYKDASIRITLSAIDGVTRIGELVAGRVRNIGDTEFGVDVGILDFSRKERDEFGDLVITERQYSKRADYPVSVRSNRIASIQQLLAGLRATPTVFIGAESQPETVVYGFYRGFNLVLRGPVFSECSIEVEGLT